jgi:tetratricopeptide (TPR) repeat protein
MNCIEILKAVTLDPKMAPLYSNRAACHLKMGDFHGCAMDCSQAITLLVPPVESNRKSRLIAYSRRAAALSQLEDFEHAIADIQQALALDPNNASLLADKSTLETKLGETRKSEEEEHGGEKQPTATDPLFKVRKYEGDDAGTGEGAKLVAGGVASRTIAAVDAGTGGGNASGEVLSAAELFQYPLTSLKQRASTLGLVGAPAGDPEKKATWVVAIQQLQTSGGADGAGSGEAESESGGLD